jgi:K+-transporting ATPase A subunit
MSQNVIAVIVLFVLLAISTPLLGSYMAKVFQNKKAPGDRVFGPIVNTGPIQQRAPVENRSAVVRSYLVA